MLHISRLKTLSNPQQWLLAAAVALVVASLLHGKKSSRKTSKLPQPASTLPILGNTLDTMKKQKHRLYDWLAEQSTLTNGKPWLLTVVGRPPAIVVTSPELFEDVMKTQMENFPKAELTLVIRDIFGRGILAVDGDEWTFQRKTASHLFSLQMMRDVMHDVVTDKIRVLCQNLMLYAKENRNVGVKRELIHFTTDVFGKIGFGVELRCLEEGRNGTLTNDFVAAFGFCAGITRSRLQQPTWLWQLKRFLNVGEERENKAHVQVINQLLFKIISESIAKKTSNNASADKSPSKDLISLFLDSILKEKSTHTTKDVDEKDMQLIRDMVVNFIFAGQDTSSQTMTQFIIQLNRFPYVLTKIRSELRAKLPNLFTRDTIEVPTMDELTQLTYLEATIRETLRLFPAVPTTSRLAAEATVLSDGTEVAKGTRVMMPAYAAARQVSVWGEDATEFKPERWLDPITGELIPVSPFKFSAFFAGPRRCLGVRLAMMEMKTALAVILSRFDLTTVDDPWTITYELALTYAIKGPVMVKVTPLASA